MRDMPELRETRKRIYLDVPPMRGINWSDDISDGDLADSANLSTRRFPYLATRKGRKAIDGYVNVTALYRYKDSLLTVEGATLKRDGVQIGVCAEGAKQWATVNTKVVMYPDALMIDMETNEVTQMGAAVHCLDDESATELTATTLRSTTYPAVLDSLESDYQRTASEAAAKVYKYGKSQKAVEECFNDGEWTFPETTPPLEVLTDVESLTVGDIIIVGSTYLPVVGLNGTTPDKTKYSADGYYGVVKYKSTRAIPDWGGSYGGGSFTVLFIAVYKAGNSNELFSNLFEIGDIIEITGTPAGVGDSKNAKITAIDAETNTITFANGATFPTCFKVLESAWSVGETVNVKLRFDSLSYVTRTATVEKNVEAGAAIVAYDVSSATGEKYELYEITDNGIVRVAKTGSEDASENLIEFALFSPGHDITVTRKLPPLDYICAHDNRLWGVSNEDGTIYGSALGLPTRFYDDELVSTDSWSVAVAGNGAFTACCEYGDSVLFWKEDRLYKLLGNTPDSYQLNDYVVPGVQAGAHGTQCIVDDVLIFKGVRGVYGYGGGVPTLISEKFGERRFTATAAGTDGERYCISLHEGDAWRLMVYDVRRGMWLREDDTQFIAYAQREDGLCAAATDGNVYRIDAGAHEPLMDSAFVQDETAVLQTMQPVEWYAQFTPMYDTLDGRKTLHKLLIRAELARDAAFSVKVRFGAGGWKKIGRIAAKRPDVYEFIMPPNRGDRYEIRLEGNGTATIMGIQKQVYVGSDA